jgi:molybdopterin converting factor small subunit
MQIRIKVLGVLKDTLGKSEIIMNFNSSTNIRIVIEKLVGQNEGLREIMMDDEIDSPFPNTLILLNGVEAKNLQGLNTSIEKNSELVLIPVTHGG